MIFEKLLDELPAKPEFTDFFLADRNPLSRRRKLRRISNPNLAMRILHQRFIKYIRDFRVHFDHVTGSVRGGSPKNNVLKHRYHRFFYLTDLKSAYQNVREEKLAEIICSHDVRLQGNKEEMLAFLKQFFLAPDGGLLVGAPASPDLFNLYSAVALDEKLHEFCLKHHLAYTRYLDDLTFSSRRNRIGKRKRREIRQIIESAGFQVHHKKSQVLDLKIGPIVINGIGLEFGGRIFLPRHFLRKINGLFHRAETKNNVPKDLISGYWGIFSDVTKGQKLNKSEWRTIKKFHQLRT